MITRKELLEALNRLEKDSRFKKGQTCFTPREAKFLVNLLFKKTADEKGRQLLFFTIADYLMNHEGTPFDKVPLNGLWVRRLKFLKALLLTGNGAQAAREAGFKGGKREAWNIIKEIRNCQRDRK